MLVNKLYNKGYIEYPIDFNLQRRTFHVEHETCFCPYHTSWEVTLLETGDMVYIPSGQNRSRDIYIVSWFHTNGTLKFPHGIFTIPMSTFTYRPKVVY